MALAGILSQLKNELAGTVKLIFQPAEEGVRGAKAMVEHGDVDDVDFATVWNKKHTLAERTGSSIDNFIAWVKKSTEAEDQKK